MSDLVLDSSGLLIRLNHEIGMAFVVDTMDSADNVFMSAVNLAEVATKLAEQSNRAADIDAALAALDITVVPFTRDDAVQIGLLRPATRSAGLSLGDRACIALAMRMNLPVLTADRAWARLDLPVEVMLAR